MGGRDRVVWIAYAVQELYTMYLTRFRTYKIGLPSQGRGLRHINTCRQALYCSIFRKSRHFGFGVFIHIWKRPPPPTPQLNTPSFWSNVYDKLCFGRSTCLSCKIRDSLGTKNRDGLICVAPKEYFVCNY